MTGNPGVHPTPTGIQNTGYRIRGLQIKDSGKENQQSLGTRQCFFGLLPCLTFAGFLVIAKQGSFFRRKVNLFFFRFLRRLDPKIASKNMSYKAVQIFGLPHCLTWPLWEQNPVFWL